MLLQTFPKLWDFLGGGELWSKTMMVLSHIAAAELRIWHCSNVRLNQRKTRQRSLVMTEDGQASQMLWQECGCVSFYGIYSLVFIVKTDTTTQQSDTGKRRVLVMFEASVWHSKDIRGMKTAEHCNWQAGKRGLRSTDPGLVDPRGSERYI